MNAYERDPGLALADRWQRCFPLSKYPFAVVGGAQGLSEAETIALFERLMAKGLMDRIGAVVRPNSAGASTLAAISAPAERLEAIAAIVSAEPYINHNYEREHAINLWFVVAAPGSPELVETLQRIERNTGCKVLDLRLIEPYHIDLGFGLVSGRAPQSASGKATRQATEEEKVLLAAIQDGLPLVCKPYAAIAQRLGRGEDNVIASIFEMQDAGILSRFGCVLRHREAGFTANAMAVWNVDDDAVDRVGRRMAEDRDVTLCYRRNRAQPLWPYNLFAMIHGRDETAVRAKIANIAQECGLGSEPQAILFSRRCFMQRGARFSRKPKGQAA
ncbi:MAG: Lrp/AsnC family transcriptional regulator [Hyphomicrobiales bacterium]|nr:Lrp/AsnC family transcriptional regulator [Hyphomicrobiales bacterium]